MEGRVARPRIDSLRIRGLQVDKCVPYIHTVLLKYYMDPPLNMEGLDHLLAQTSAPVTHVTLRASGALGEGTTEGHVPSWPVAGQGISPCMPGVSHFTWMQLATAY